MKIESLIGKNKVAAVAAIPADLAGEIWEYRRVNKMTQKEFGDMVGLSRTYVSYLENEETASEDMAGLSIDLYLKILNVLGFLHLQPGRTFGGLREVRRERS